MSLLPVVRFPPSPTGLLHIGTARTCLYNYLFARQHNGKILFRFEDTDTGRSKKEFEENILSGLQKLGISWDEGPFFQSQRGEIYASYLQKLLDLNSAYPCFCTPEELEQERQEQERKKLPPRYSGKCRHLLPEEQKERQQSGEKHVFRLRVPEDRALTFTDAIRGEITIHTREIADFVIAKGKTEPLYNFCVVVDDAEMGVTHVIRGEDHIPNTPKQILIFEALGFSLPQFAHLPLLLNTDRSKMSKRKNQVSVDDFLNEGILPEALINYLGLLGWNPGTTEETFSLSELVNRFSLDRVQKSGAIFDRARLLFVNQQYISRLSDENFFLECEKHLPRFAHENFWKKVCLLARSRMQRFADLPILSQFFLISDEHFSPAIDLFVNSKMQVDRARARSSIADIAHFWETLSSDDWTHDRLKENTLNWIKEKGEKNGQILWPTRVGLTGEAFSPSPFEVADTLGKERSLFRLHKSLGVLDSEA